MHRFYTALVTSFFIFTTLASVVRADDDLEQEKSLSRAYIALMAAEPGATTIESGIVFRPLYMNEAGAQPTVSDTVHVLYQLWDREGALLDDGFATDEIPKFPLMRLINCWKIAVPQMRVGSFAKVTCPSETAYGDRGAGDGLIKPGAALTFRIQLLGFEKTL